MKNPGNSTGKHRQEVHDRIAREHPELAERFRERRHLLDEHLKEKRPEVYELVIQLRKRSAMSRENKRNNSYIRGQ